MLVRSRYCRGDSPVCSRNTRMKWITLAKCSFSATAPTGSSVSVKKEDGQEKIYITGCLFVKAGFTLNNALVRNGLATTSNPLYQSWQEQAKRKKLGIWRDAK